MAKLSRNPDAFKWKCGRCDTWNAISRGTCSTCRSMVQVSASAFRLRNELTSEEENFYLHSAPAIIMELRGVKNLLAEILNTLRKQRGGTANGND